MDTEMQLKRNNPPRIMRSRTLNTGLLLLIVATGVFIKLKCEKA